MHGDWVILHATHSRYKSVEGRSFLVIFHRNRADFVSEPDGGQHATSVSVRCVFLMISFVCVLCLG